MTQYGEVALRAVEYLRSGKVNQPPEAYDRAASKICKSKSSREKPCPRCAFLGLCEDVKIKGISGGSYMRALCGEKKNKQYAITAIQILQEMPALSQHETKLWQEVKKKLGSKRKNHEGDMHVVTALWNKHLLNLTSF